MIPSPTITAWSRTAPWATRAQIEQDLLLSRLIIDIAHHPYLGQELVFRGGTCLHKLHLHPARRYSEDLDYVRTSPGGISELTHTLSELGRALGMDVTTRIGVHPKVYFRSVAEDGTRLRVKVEVNTHERSPAVPLVQLPFAVESSWYTASADVNTFHPTELIATKIRALYQRKKGRDLFDLWLALTELKLDSNAILAAFGPYRPEGLTRKTAEANLRAKLDDPDFRDDLTLLVTTWPDGYDLTTAADLVITTLHARL
ncbi:nucleotidyl transferase AbiEii/AbiGii toxin family protein [Kineococcus sp. R86509]|uniref:nucleotidyl transferase AbiEii/AbiGii toxin family protein n=1 Tax=Kineococcus sp. R86509 TaxID=3093851 RepID=UPI0036D3577C